MKKHLVCLGLENVSYKCIEIEVETTTLINLMMIDCNNNNGTKQRTQNVFNEVPQKIRGEKIRKIACNLTYIRTIYSHKTSH